VVIEFQLLQTLLAREWVAEFNNNNNAILAGSGGCSRLNNNNMSNAYVFRCCVR